MDEGGKEDEVIRVRIRDAELREGGREGGRMNGISVGKMAGRI